MATFPDLTLDQFGSGYTLRVSANSLPSTTTDPFEVDPFAVVANTSDTGDGSLRQAILDANNLPGQPHVIALQLPAGPQTVTLQSPLPTATDPLTLSLDATQNVTIIGSSPAALENTQTFTLSGPGNLSLVGGIAGTGNLVVDAGSDLTADSIVQNTLTIGAGATVTIAPSGPGGGMEANSSVNNTQSTVAASGTALAERIAAVAAQRAEATAAILGSQDSQAPAAANATLSLADSSNAEALAASTTLIPSAAVTVPDALVTAPIAIIPDESRQVGLATTSQLVATEPVSLAAATPIVTAITPQAISIAENAPLASQPDMPQGSLSQIDFAGENASAFALFAANFSPPVSSSPVSTATTATAFAKRGFHNDRIFQSGACGPPYKYCSERQRCPRAISRSRGDRLGFGGWLQPHIRV